MHFLSKDDIDTKKIEIQSQIQEHDIVLYMKGTPDFPSCGFSATVVGILNHLNVPYTSFNVLEDDALRHCIKEFSAWPTIPQLYIKQEFIGGCDIVKEMFDEGELQTTLKLHNIKSKT
tara:strand:- start:106 stop:459 length:354 start_codon:yes stop_codon:yes gene_type:complete